MRTHSRLLCLSLLAAALPVQAQVYRCTGPSGEPLFTQRHCGEPVALDTVKPGPPSSGSPTGLRPGELSWLKARQRERGKAARKARRRAAPKSSAVDRQAYQCQRKRRLLDAVRAKLRRGYKPAQGEGLRRRRHGYEDYIAAFCR